ncbi:uncharacterized protein LOC119692066 [Plutella xylostella]|uniref:uncharacterized protein LOC119692066 n=1 Tax=Plutella xylostella TaxID=51655 RepID=UPI002032BC50|nr:uncharacterized protein LOC119692066 [Plutella xylostella]
MHVLLPYLWLVLLLLTPPASTKHTKVIIHVPYKVHRHKHTHTIVRHVHHKPASHDHYEVLGYTYGEKKPVHFGGGHGWYAADNGGLEQESPVHFTAGGNDLGLENDY